MLAVEGLRQLCEAVRDRRFETVQALLGANPALKAQQDPQSGDTILHVVARYNTEEHMRIASTLLLPNTSVLSVKNRAGYTALHIAAQAGNHLLVDALVAECNRPSRTWTWSFVPTAVYDIDVTQGEEIYKHHDALYFALECKEPTAALIVRSLLIGGIELHKSCIGSNIDFIWGILARMTERWLEARKAYHAQPTAALGSEARVWGENVERALRKEAAIAIGPYAYANFFYSGTCRNHSPGKSAIQYRDEVVLRRIQDILGSSWLVGGEAFVAIGAFREGSDEQEAAWLAELERKGVDFQAIESGTGNSVWHQAVLSKKLGVLKWLSTKPALKKLIDQKNTAGWTPLGLALQSKEPTLLAAVLAAEAGLGVACCPEKLLPVHWVARFGTEWMLEYLVNVQQLHVQQRKAEREQGTFLTRPAEVDLDLDAVDAKGKTALHHAVERGHLGLAYGLLYVGADRNAWSEQCRQTPWDLSRGHMRALLDTYATTECAFLVLPEVAKCLEAVTVAPYQIDPRTISQEGWNCFDVAVGLSRAEIVDYALAHAGEAAYRNLLAPEIMGALLNVHAEEGGLALSMQTQETQHLAAEYHALLNHPRIGAARLACNRALGFVPEQYLSWEALRVYFTVREHQRSEAYAVYQKVHLEVERPVLQALEAYCSRQTTYEQYVRAHYGAQKWFAFTHRFQGACVTGMVDIVAQQLGACIIIRDQHRVLYQTQSYGTQERVLFYQNQHFAAIVPRTAEQLAQATLYAQEKILRKMIQKQRLGEGTKATYILSDRKMWYLDLRKPLGRGLHAFGELSTEQYAALYRTDNRVDLQEDGKVFCGESSPLVVYMRNKDRNILIADNSTALIRDNSPGQWHFNGEHSECIGLTLLRVKRGQPHSGGLMVHCARVSFARLSGWQLAWLEGVLGHRHLSFEHLDVEATLRNQGWMEWLGRKNRYGSRLERTTAYKAVTWGGLVAVGAVAAVWGGVGVGLATVWVTAVQQENIHGVFWGGRKVYEGLHALTPPGAQWALNRAAWGVYRGTELGLTAVNYASMVMNPVVRVGSYGFGLAAAHVVQRFGYSENAQAVAYALGKFLVYRGSGVFQQYKSRSRNKAGYALMEYQRTLESVQIWKALDPRLVPLIEAFHEGRRFLEQGLEENALLDWAIPLTEWWEGIYALPGLDHLHQLQQCLGSLEQGAIQGLAQRIDSLWPEAHAYSHVLGEIAKRAPMGKAELQLKEAQAETQKTKEAYEEGFDQEYGALRAQLEAEYSTAQQELQALEAQEQLKDLGKKEPIALLSPAALKTKDPGLVAVMGQYVSPELLAQAESLHEQLAKTPAPLGVTLAEGEARVRHSEQALRTLDTQAHNDPKLERSWQAYQAAQNREHFAQQQFEAALHSWRTALERTPLFQSHRKVEASLQELQAVPLTDTEAWKEQEQEYQGKVAEHAKLLGRLVNQQFLQQAQEQEEQEIEDKKFRVLEQQAMAQEQELELECREKRLEQKHLLMSAPLSIHPGSLVAAVYSFDKSRVQIAKEVGDMLEYFGYVDNQENTELQSFFRGAYSGSEKNRVFRLQDRVAVVMQYDSSGRLERCTVQLNEVRTELQACKAELGQLGKAVEFFSGLSQARAHSPFKQHLQELYQPLIEAIEARTEGLAEKRIQGFAAIEAEPQQLIALGKKVNAIPAFKPPKKGVQRWAPIVLEVGIGVAIGNMPGAFRALAVAAVVGLKANYQHDRGASWGSSLWKASVETVPAAMGAIALPGFKLSYSQAVNLVGAIRHGDLKGIGVHFVLAQVPAGEYRVQHQLLSLGGAYVLGGERALVDALVQAGLQRGMEAFAGEVRNRWEEVQAQDLHQHMEGARSFETTPIEGGEALWLDLVPAPLEDTLQALDYQVEALEVERDNLLFRQEMRDLYGGFVQESVHHAAGFKRESSLKPVTQALLAGTSVGDLLEPELIVADKPKTLLFSPHAPVPRKNSTTLSEQPTQEGFWQAFSRGHQQMHFIRDADAHPSQVAMPSAGAEPIPAQTPGAWSLVWDAALKKDPLAQQQLRGYFPGVAAFTDGMKEFQESPTGQTLDTVGKGLVFGAAGGLAVEVGGALIVAGGNVSQATLRGFELYQKKRNLQKYGAGNAVDRARNNFNISNTGSSASSSRLNTTTQTAGPHNASNPNAQAALNRKMRSLEKAQREAVKTQTFSDGRIRYYAGEKPSTKPGLTRGAAHVTEYNPKTGQVRTWHESYDHQGNVNRIHPKMLDGQNVTAQHYPPTKAELEASTLKKWRSK